MIALSNGNISLNNLSLFDNKNKSKKTIESEASNSTGKVRKRKSTKSSTNKPRKKKSDNTFGFNINDIDTGMKLMDLSEDDLERGMEIITRTKKYMSTDERKILVKVESVLDLVRGIKKLSSIDIMQEDETDFFRSMDEEDKKNMMIKEILEVFPEKRKDSLNKAIDIKKKIDLFAELFLPDDFGEGGFSLSSLANINNLGSMGNLKLLGSLLRADDDEDYDEDEYEDTDEYIEEEYKDDFDYSKYENDEDDT
ncbi:MAG: hypothetical protein IJ086_07310 [Clostridium sp.]|nr:hypothetical protein [Clostridium sp.]